jgi:hypothetical protein
MVMYQGARRSIVRDFEEHAPIVNGIWPVVQFGEWEGAMKISLPIAIHDCCLSGKQARTMR